MTLFCVRHAGIFDYVRVNIFIEKFDFESLIQSSDYWKIGDLLNKKFRTEMCLRLIKLISEWDRGYEVDFTTSRDK